MKTSRYLLVVVAIAMTIFSSCNCDDDPIAEETLATVKTLAISDVTTTGAVVTGSITDNGNSEITRKGFCWKEKSSAFPTVLDSLSIVNGDDESFSDSVEMTPGKTYYIRAYAVNTVGVAYGNLLEVKALGGYPSITEVSVTCTDKSALVKAKINNSNLSTAVTLEYGTTTSYGQSVSVNVTAVANVNMDVFDLNYSTKYYYRIKAENSVGAVSVTGSFTTTTPTVTDIDGNVYKSVKIGDQIWTIENLKTTRYNDGTSIPNVISDEDWLRAGDDQMGARCYYNNDPELGKVYGGLYNWYAVNTGKLAPKGWHVPTNAEWVKLIIALGRMSNDCSGHAAREVGTAHWKAPNEGATNASGFTALPGGSRALTNAILTFDEISTDAEFWSADELRPGVTRIVYASYNLQWLMNDYSLKNLSGLSIRLVKD